MKFLLAWVCILAPLTAAAQIQQTLPLSTPAADFATNAPSSTPTSLDGSEYRIGRDDLIEVSVFEIPELGTTARITASGSAALPLIGVIPAAGETPQELAQSIERALKIHYVNDPHVQVFVREYASQPVSVIGAVRIPGIYQIKGQKLLVDILAMAQGPTESAGKIIQIMRRKPAVDGTSTPATETISIDSQDLFQNGQSDLNIPILAGDVINVLNAGSIFAEGELTRPGEFVLRYGKNVTVAQAVALAGGPTKDAKKKECVIIRPHADGTQEQIPVDYQQILSGAMSDIMMMPNDVLFVPANKVKAGLSRALDSAINVVIGRAIYAGF